MPKITVVIPVYKVEKFLPACLDSVLSQSLQDIEVICIDDASPDRCPEILDEYAARDARVRVLHLPENHQQGYGRNRGTEMARGKYIYFLDSDDMITSEALEELYTVAEKDRLDGVYFDSQVIFANRELEKINCNYPARRHGKYDNCVYSGPALFELFMKQGDWISYVQRTFWRREFLLYN
ncbi:MAG: glycosyltransferase family 2 protein, partial [Bacteroidales bacterium]|nr:glycosyltransferase family 2 protein [Bacteroidales bacterium]